MKITTYGIYDSVDRLWLGDKKGPTTFTDHLLARVAAQVVDVRLGQPEGRTVAKEYEPGAKRLRDSVDTIMTAERALQVLEGGGEN